MISKRGMSEVITTVLIILIAIVAVAIIWVLYVKPMINTAGQSASGQAACFNVQVKPTHCSVEGDVTLQLVSDGNQNVTSLFGVAKNGAGTSKAGSVTWASTNTVGDSVIVRTGLYNAVSATGYAEIAINGKTFKCSQSTSEINC